MKRNVSLLVAAVALIAGLALPLAAEDQQEQAIDAEVVFVLDTTGSMSGLIEGAKQKIWSIAGGIIQRTGGRVRIGLVPYRDRGDLYVTKVFPLTDNLDQVYADLQGFRAEGGGDTPESVNQALYEAVAQIQWSDSPRVMRTIFLVGDCPPHMDYEDDVKYPASCAMAARKNIVVNTVQCGGDPGTVPHWRKIARLTNGGYTRIGQSGDMKMVETPFDREIQRINIEISRTILPYGAAPTQSSMRKRVRLNVAAAPAVAAERNAVKAESFARDDLAAPVGGLDLTAEPEKLAELKPEELPEELQTLAPAERQARLEQAVERRKMLNAQLVELNAKRAAYLLEAEKSRTAGAAPAGFDAEVLKSVDAQLQQLRSGATLEAK
jgi:Mg-chelatase subunit ChlD